MRYNKNDMSKQNTSIKSISPSLPMITKEKPDRLPQGALNEYFVEYYLECADMTEAYRRAARAYGHDFKDKYASQYGKALYTRLQKQINEAIDNADIDDHLLGRKVQRELAMKAESETTRLQAANALCRKKADKLVLTDERTIDDLDGSIEALQRELDNTEGKDLH